MPDRIDLLQKILGALLTPRLFSKDVNGARNVNGRQGLLSPRVFSKRYEGIIGRVHIHDDMLQCEARDHLDHYIQVGLSAMQNMEESLAACGRSWSDVDTCLDMPSGYGRVTRHLQTKIKPDRITACDIDAQAVRFLAAEFGVKPVVSHLDFSKIQFPDTYDLIYVGSLFTHLDQDSAAQLFEVFYRILRPRGVLVFSTCGETCLNELHIHGWMFAQKEKEFREGVASEGIAFFPYYANDPKWGVTIQTRDRIERFMQEKFGGGMKLVRFAQRGLDHHQDVYAYQKVEK